MKTIMFFRGDIDHVNTCLVELVLQWLKLSHTLHAIRSPRATQELQNEIPALQELR